MMSKKDSLAEFNAEMFAKVSYFCAGSSDYRQNLKGVYLFKSDFGGIHLVASDGISITFFYDPNGYSYLTKLFIPLRDPKSRKMSEFTKFARMTRNKNNNIKLLGERITSKSFESIGTHMHLRLNGSDFRIPNDESITPMKKDVLKSAVPEMSSIKKIDPSFYNQKILDRLPRLKVTNKKQKELLATNKKQKGLLGTKPIDTSIAIKFGERNELIVLGKNVCHIAMPLIFKDPISLKEHMYHLAMKNDDILFAALHKKNLNKIFETISIEVSGSYYDSLK